MKISSNDTFEINEFVFSKLKGYPWWPGQIINIEKNGKKLIYNCADSSTNTISKISDNKCIAKFEENIDYILKNPKGKKHLDAISTAIENFFERKKMPKKYKKILEDIKNGNYGENTMINPIDKESSKENEEKESKDNKNRDKKIRKIKKDENHSDENTINIEEENNNGRKMKNIKNKEIKKDKNDNHDDMDRKIDYLLNKKRKHAFLSGTTNNKNDKLTDNKNKKTEKEQILETKKENENNKEKEKEKEK